MEAAVSRIRRFLGSATALFRDIIAKAKAPCLQSSLGSRSIKCGVLLKFGVAIVRQGYRQSFVTGGAVSHSVYQDALRFLVPSA
jgi:hypothetical protein